MRTVNNHDSSSEVWHAKISQHGVQRSDQEGCSGRIFLWRYENEATDLDWFEHGVGQVDDDFTRGNKGPGWDQLWWVQEIVWEVHQLQWSISPVGEDWETASRCCKIFDWFLRSFYKCKYLSTWLKYLNDFIFLFHFDPNVHCSLVDFTFKSLLISFFGAAGH